MRVLVYGGRDYAGREALFAELDRIDKANRIEVVVHGAARGADTLGGEWATLRDRVTVAFPARWDVHGKSAGPLRNQQMIDEGRIDLAVQCPGGRGTADMRARLIKAGIGIVGVRA